MKKFRYVGQYGRRGRPGAVPYIGDLFYMDEVFHDEEAKLLRFVRPNMPAVEATDQALSVLRGGDFSAEVTCEHRFATGEGCAKKPVEGGKLCAFHEKVDKLTPEQATEFLRDNAQPMPTNRTRNPAHGDSVEPPLPPELVSSPDAMIFESVPSVALDDCLTTGTPVGGCDPNGRKWPRCVVCNRREIPTPRYDG